MPYKVGYAGISAGGYSHGIAGLSRHGGAPAFSPASLSPLAWFRADMGVLNGSDAPAADGDSVKTWTDQATSPHNLTQSTGANQPKFVASDAAYNNKPLIQAVATTHYLANTSFSHAQPVTIFVVGEYSTSGAVLFASDTGSTAPQIIDSSGNTEMYAGTALTVAIAHNTPRAFMFVVNGGSSINGVSNWVSGGTSGAAGAGTMSRLSVFAYATGTFSTVGKCAEVIVLAGAVGSTDKSNLATYFGSRYGITVS